MTRFNVFQVVTLWALLAVAGCGGKRARWEPDPQPSTPRVWLQLVSLSDQELVVEVVGADLPDLYGVAYRLQFDPAALTLVSHTPDAAYWPASPAILHHGLTPAQAPDRVVAGITRRGDVAGVDVGPATSDGGGQVLARLVFSRRSPRSATSVGFVAPRCAAYDSTGAVIPNVSWVGGDVVLK